MKRGAELQEHIFDTYISLRYGVAALALLFPWVVLLAGAASGSGVRGSLSAYFCRTASQGCDVDGAFAARSFFVGILCAVGAALYLYKGFSNLENYLLNIAGASAWVVALVPTDCGDACSRLQLDIGSRTLTLHGTAAVVLFGCVALVCLLCSSDTLDQLPDRTTRRRYETGYKVLGVLMVVLPLAAVFLTVVVRQTGFRILAVEVAGTVVFGLYWLVKSIELSKSEAQKKAARGELR